MFVANTKASLFGIDWFTAGEGDCEAQPWVGSDKVESTESD